MEKLDIVEIQKNVEERRLMLGGKIEDLLKGKIRRVKNFCRKLLEAKSSAFFGCFLIIALSLLIRSTRDVGHDSLIYLEISRKIFSGGKYYFDFLDFNLPLGFLLAGLAWPVSRLLAVDPIIAVEIVANSFGVASLYFSARILKRSNLNQAAFNLVLWSFACGFFLRIFTLQFNEFGTKSTFLLAFIFPYVSYQFLREAELKKADQLFIGALAALIFALKPHYGLIVIIFELAKLSKSGLFKPLFCLRNYFTLLLLAIYLGVIVKFFPEYVNLVLPNHDLYFSHSGCWLFILLREDMFAVFLAASLGFALICKNADLQKFLLLSLAMALVVNLEIIGGYDQRFLFYSLSLPLLVLLLYHIISQDLINWKKDGIILWAILLVSQFDAKNVFNMALDLTSFWWVFVLIMSRRWNRRLGDRKRIKNIFLPRNPASWAGFSVLAGGLIILSFDARTSGPAWVICAIIFVLMLVFYQKLHEEFYETKKLSRISACAIFLVASYFLGLHSSAIFNLKTHYYAHRFKSPNHFTKQMISIVKTHSDAQERLVVIPQSMPGFYPSVSYAKRASDLLTLSPALDRKILDEKQEMNEAEKFLLENLKRQMVDEKNKLLFVEIKMDVVTNLCRISFLEYYLRRDAEFKQIFLQNYVFLNRIIDYKNSGHEVEFFKSEQGITWAGEPVNSERDVEVYIRK